MLVIPLGRERSWSSNEVYRSARENRATGITRPSTDLHWLSPASQLKSRQYTYANRVQHSVREPVLTYIISCSLSQLLFSDQSYPEWKEGEDREADRKQ